MLDPVDVILSETNHPMRKKKPKPKKIDPKKIFVFPKGKRKRK